MRIIILLAFGLFYYAGAVQAQVGSSISADGTSPNTNAMLDVQSPSTGDGKGILIPRVTLAQRTTASSALAGGLLDDSGDLRGGAAQGLIVYQTDDVQGLYFNTSLTATPAWMHLGENANGVSVGQGANGFTYGAAMGYETKGTNYGAAVGFQANGSVSGAAVGRSANGYTVGAAMGYLANGYTVGAAMGYLANGSSYGAAVGYLANGSSYGAAVGREANSVDNGAAVGYWANGHDYGAAVGREANGSEGAAMGYLANGCGYGAAMGLAANGYAYGMAMGSTANGYDYGAAMGWMANGTKTNVAIGYRANAGGGTERIAIGHNVTNNVDNSTRIRGNLYLDGGTNIYTNTTFGGSTWYVKAFTIDHPLDPENKVLRHFCLEGPQVWNVYAGNTQLVNGQAVVELPDYYSALNLVGSEIYGLTVVDKSANQFPLVKVAKKVENNHFVIAGTMDVEVSWAIKVLRNDPGCLEDLLRRPVEQLKRDISN